MDTMTLSPTFAQSPQSIPINSKLLHRQTLPHTVLPPLLLPLAQYSLGRVDACVFSFCASFALGPLDLHLVVRNLELLHGDEIPLKQGV
jgi:hypothetical protein